MLQSQLAGPAGVREFEALADAANLKKGTPEYQRAASIRLGMEGRASNAGFGFRNEDINGVPTLVITDPRTGRTRPAMLEDVQAPLADAMPPAQSAAGSGSLLDIGALTQDFQSQFPGVAITSGFRTPEKNAAVDGVPNSFHLTGEAFDVATRTPQETQAAMAWAQQNGLQAINEGDHVHFEPPRRGVTTNPLPGRPIQGRRKEDEAAAVEAAKYGAQINAQPALNALEAQGAGMTTAAQEAARIDAYRQATADVVDREAQVTQAKKGAEAQADVATALMKKQINANESLAILEEAKRILPSATSGRIENAGSQTAAYFGKSTPGARATAKLNLLSAKLVANVPRFEGPQSNVDVQFYREAAGDLANPNLPVATRMAAAEAMIQMQQKYATPKSQPAAGGGGWKITKVK